MKILSDLINKKKNRDQSHFFLFANREYNKSIEHLLLDDPYFLHSQSISVFFNTGKPIQHYPIVQSHNNKWIFFRLLAKNHEYNTYFRDLKLLLNYDFQKYFFIPDLIDPNYKDKNYTDVTTEYLLKNNIDLKNLGHLSLFDSEELSKIKNNYPNKSDEQNKKLTMTSGFWVYLYLRNHYPDASFTLVDYGLNFSSNYHSPNFEKGYILSDILNKRCRYLGFDII
jgi:hypothetical protein